MMMMLMVMIMLMVILIRRKFMTAINIKSSINILVMMRKSQVIHSTCVRNATHVINKGEVYYDIYEVYIRGSHISVNCVIMKQHEKISLRGTQNLYMRKQVL